MGDTRTTATGTVAASPEAVFTVLADPSRHQDIDGAGMLQGMVDGPQALTAVGQSFDIDMHQEGIGDYGMRNTVTEFEPGRRITWAPNVHPPGSMAHIVGDMKTGGHVYSWVLTPNASGGTDIEHFCDWSGVEDEGFKTFFPRVSAEQLSESIQRVGKLAG
ncbi:MAG: SRPBCC family protein [Sporichthyaceae bacterium]